jgi:hypothetical protein
MCFINKVLQGFNDKTPCGMAILLYDVKDIMPWPETPRRFPIFFLSIRLQSNNDNNEKD